MKKLLPLLLLVVCAFSLKAQNFDLVKNGYKADDTLHIQQYVNSNSVYFISDTRFVYCDINNLDTLIGGVSPFFIGIYDVEKKNIITQMHSQSFELKFVVSPSGNHMVVFDEKGATIYALLNHSYFKLLGTIDHVTLSQTKQATVFTNNDEKLIIPHDGKIDVIAILPDKVVKTKQVSNFGAGVIWGAAINTKDSLALACSDGQIYLTDTTLSGYKSIAPFTTEATDIVYNPQDKVFIAVSANGLASFTAAGKVKTVFELEEGITGGLTTLSTPYNGYFVVGSFDKPHRLLSIPDALNKAKFSNKTIGLSIEKVNVDTNVGDDLPMSLYYDYRHVGTSPNYNYIVIALPWNDIVIMKGR